MFAPECGTRHRIFAAQIAGLLRRERSAEGRVQDAGVLDDARAFAQDALLRPVMGRIALLLVRTRDHGHLVLLPRRQIDQARVPCTISARRVRDLGLADRRVAHDRAVEAARHGAEITRQRDGLDEEGASIGKAIEEVAELGLGEAVIDVAGGVLFHRLVDAKARADLTAFGRFSRKLLVVLGSLVMPSNVRVSSNGHGNTHEAGRARLRLKLAAIAYVNARHGVDADAGLSRAGLALLASAAIEYYEALTGADPSKRPTDPVFQIDG